MSTTQLSNNLPPFTQAGHTNILPLTTLFTPPHDCTAASAYTAELWPAGSGSSGLKYVFLADDGGSKSSCYPSSYSKYQHDKDVYYSPGVCPLSYEYVATSVQSEESGPPITLAMCCPSGIHHLIQNKNACSFVYSTDQPGLSIAWPSGSSPADTTTLFAQRIAVAWQETDLAIFTPASAPLQRIPAASTTSGPTTDNGQAPAATSPVPKDPLATSDLASSDSSSSLSVGATAGIVVGAVIGGLCLLSALGYLLLRSKRRSKAPSNLERHQQNRVSSKYELEGKCAEVTEVPDNGRPFEVDGQNGRVELEGNWEVPEASNGVRSPA